MASYAHTTLVYIRDCLTYIRKVATHTLDYANTDMANIVSQDILPVEELRTMLRHI